MKYCIWHNTIGQADQYFILNKETHKVVTVFGCLFPLPKWLGKLLMK